MAVRQGSLFASQRQHQAVEQFSKHNDRVSRKVLQVPRGSRNPQPSEHRGRTSRSRHEYAREDSAGAVVKNDHIVSEIAAEAAQLRYVSDRQRGISRQRTKAGFRYFDANGKVISDAAKLERIRRLAVPPAWNDVWICPLENGHIQATGRDARARKQYRYHPRWRGVRDETKHDRMLQFGRSLPAIRQP